MKGAGGSSSSTTEGPGGSRGLVLQVWILLWLCRSRAAREGVWKCCKCCC